MYLRRVVPILRRHNEPARHLARSWRWFKQCGLAKQPHQRRDTFRVALQHAIYDRLNERLQAGLALRKSSHNDFIVKHPVKRFAHIDFAFGPTSRVTGFSRLELSFTGRPLVTDGLGLRGLRNVRLLSEARSPRGGGVATQRI